MSETERGSAEKRLARLAWYLDNSIPIPGVNFRFGLDALIGLFPGIGDTIGALLSSYLLAEAARLGAPKSVLMKMAFNIAIDTVVGAIPVLGDLFDVVWKANLRNAQLLGTYLEQPRKAVIRSRLFLWSLGLLLAAFVVFAGLLAYAVVRWMWLQIIGQ